jgi:hypothetical protein
MNLTQLKAMPIGKLVELDLSSNTNMSSGVMKILSEQRLISAEVAIAADALKEMVRQATEARVTTVSDQQKLAANIDAVVAVSAILEEIMDSQRLSREDEKEVAIRLLNAQKNLELVRLNFKGL